jgi:hypothetical protein
MYRATSGQPVVSQVKLKIFWNSQVQKNILDIALASLLANAGADMSVIKRHGAWKSSNVAD